MPVRESFAKTFLKGAAVVLPIIIIGMTVYWLLYSLEAGLGGMLRLFIPDSLYFPGFGMIAGLALTYGVGLSLTSRAAQRLFDRVQRFFEHIPLIKTLYGSVQDFVEMMAADKRRKFNRVVRVKVKDTGLQLIGFVTREDLRDLPLGESAKEEVAVYLPMSYQVGGYMVLVPKTAIEPIPISIEDATRLIFTSAVSVQRREEPSTAAASTPVPDGPPAEPT